MRKALILLTLLSFSFVAQAQKGTIRGQIIDNETGEGLIGATAQIKGTTNGGVTDFDGNYTIINLAPGSYEIQVSYVSYQSKTITGVEVKAGEVAVLDVRLSTDVQQLEEIVVAAEVIRNSETALMTVKRKSPNLLDGISAQSFRRIGDSDAASAIKRVPGVSLQGGKYVYIRGLGDRYTKSILNSVDIPGLDPDRNTLQIDIFPTSLIDNILVLKSFTPDLSADFTGGMVNIETKDFPEEKTLNISGSLGFNPSMHFNGDYLSYEGGGTDFLGFDDGTRDLPLSRDTDIPNPALGDPTLTELTRSFDATLAAMPERSFMDYSLGISTGNQLNRPKVTWGYNAALSYRNSTRYYERAQFGSFLKPTESDQTELLTNRSQVGQLGSNNVLLSGMLGGALKTNNSKLKLNVLHLQNGETRAAKYITGFFIFASNTVSSDNLDFSERSITNVLLSGDHFLNNGQWEINWKLAPTWSNIDDKDVRQTPFRLEDGIYTIEPSEAGDPIRIWRFLDEVNYVGKLDATRKYQIHGKESKVKFGASQTIKQRDFSIENYRLGVRRPSQITFTGDADQLMEEEFLWTPRQSDGSGDIGTFVRGNFEPSNTFEAEQRVFGAYVSNELTVGQKLKTILGVRAEQFDHFYTGQDQQFAAGDSVNGRFFDDENVLSTFNLFPSVNLIYALTEQANLRLSYTKTVARPSFKEKSIAQIFDPITDNTFIGNIDLDETTVDNIDLRWEMFMQRAQTVSVSLFLKRFKNPIELVSFQSDPRNFQPRNVDEADVYGVEIEFRKNLGFITNALENLSVNVNTSFIESRVSISDEELQGRLEFVKDGETVDDTRELQGQSPYLINAGFTYNDSKGWEGALFYNVQGERLAVVGINRAPDTFDQPFHSLNLNLTKQLGGPDGKTRIGLGIDNILDDELESFSKAFGSTDKVYSRLAPGRRFTLRFGYSFY